MGWSWISKPEPLKDKVMLWAEEPCFDFDNVKYAVEWLKEQIQSRTKKKTSEKIMNPELEELGCNTKCKVTTWHVLSQEELLKLINEAFADVVKENLK